MKSDHFLHIARRSLRLPVYHETFAHEGELFGLYGDEALSHRKGGFVTIRHNAVRDFFHQVGCDAVVTQSKETVLTLEDGSTYKADIFYPNGLPGVSDIPLAVDFTFTNELCPTEIKVATRGQGRVAADGENHKNSKLQKRVEKNELISFLPLSFECFGGHGIHAKPLIYFLIKAYAAQKGLTKSETATRFWTDLSFKIQIANASAIVHARKAYESTLMTQVDVSSSAWCILVFFLSL